MLLLYVPSLQPEGSRLLVGRGVTEPLAEGETGPGEPARIDRAGRLARTVGSLEEGGGIGGQGAGWAFAGAFVSCFWGVFGLC